MAYYLARRAEVDTTVDLDWVWDYIHLTSDDTTRRLDLGALRDDVDFWFSPASLDTIMGNGDGETERIAREWLSRAGKRWRPFLAVAAFQALRSDTGSPLPSDLKKIAVAVERALHAQQFAQIGRAHV